MAVVNCTVRSRPDSFVRRTSPLFFSSVLLELPVSFFGESGSRSGLPVPDVCRTHEREYAPVARKRLESVVKLTRPADVCDRPQRKAVYYVCRLNFERRKFSVAIFVTRHARLTQVTARSTASGSTLIGQFPRSLTISQRRWRVLIRKFGIGSLSALNSITILDRAAQLAFNWSSTAIRPRENDNRRYRRERWVKI